MSSIVSLKSKFIREGRLQKSDLRIAFHEYKSFPPAIHLVFLNILSKFEIIYPLSSETWLVPCLLDSEIPKEVYTSLKAQYTSPPEGVVQYARIYKVGKKISYVSSYFT